MTTEKAQQEPVMINVGAERSGSHVITPPGTNWPKAARDKKIVWFSCMMFYETIDVVYNYEKKACGGPYQRRKLGVSYVVSREVYTEIGKKCLSVATENEAIIPMDLDWNRMWYWASGIEEWYTYLAEPWTEAIKAGSERERFPTTVARFINIIKEKLDNWTRNCVYCEPERRTKEELYKKKLMYMVAEAPALVQAVEDLGKKKWGECKKLELELRCRNKRLEEEDKERDKREDFIRKICHLNAAVKWNLILAPRVARWMKHLNSDYVKSHIPSLENRTILRKNDMYRICKHPCAIEFTNEQIVCFVEGLTYHHKVEKVECVKTFKAVDTVDTVDTVEADETCEVVPPEMLVKFWEDLKNRKK